VKKAQGWPMLPESARAQRFMGWSKAKAALEDRILAARKLAAKENMRSGR
jgi:hypothetical protein